MIVHARYPVGETRVQREASALVAAGWQVDVICLREEGEASREVVDGVFVRRLPVSRHRGTHLLMQLVEYMTFLILAFGSVGFRHLRRRYTSVQVHNLPDFLVFAALVPKLTRTPVILDLHDLMPEFFAARTGRSENDPLVRLVALQERLACGFADRVVTVTDGWRRTLSQRGVPIEKIHVVMNVADTALFSLVEARTTVRDDEFHLLYHGTFAHRYGVDLLIDAVDRLRSQIPAVRLRLLGDGEFRDAVRRRIDELGVADHVELSDGMLAAEELPGHIAWADVGLVPNRADVFTDGILPTKLLEYVATGTPVVCARTRTVEEYFDDSMLAYFEPGNVEDLCRRVIELYRDPQKRADLAAGAAAFNQEHGWSSVAARYVEMVARAG